MVYQLELDNIAGPRAEHFAYKPEPVRSEDDSPLARGMHYVRCRLSTMLPFLRSCQHSANVTVISVSERLKVVKVDCSLSVTSVWSFPYFKHAMLPLFIFTLETASGVIILYIFVKASSSITRLFKISFCGMATVCKEAVVDIRSVYSICRSFDSLLEKTLGPNGKSALINTPIGQVLITNVGCTILRCMDIGHPIGTTIVKSISTHHSFTGDGSKTFVLYLTSILGSIASFAEEKSSSHVSEQRNSLAYAVHYIRSHLLSNVLLPALHKNCCIMDVNEDKNATMTVMCNIVKSHLCGKYTEAIRSHLSHLLVNFLCSGVADFRTLSTEINMCIDNFNLLCIDVDCMPPLSSCIYDGIVIQRDFLSFHQSRAECCQARFILLHSSFNGNSELSSTFEAKGMPSLDKAFLWKSHCNTALASWLHKNNVNLILSTGSVDDSLQMLCAKASISMVQFVDKEDIERLTMLYHISAVEFMSDLLEVEADNFIGFSNVCEAKVFGQKRFVCLKFPDHSCPSTQSDPVERSHAAEMLCLKRQLVICGMSSGSCQQIRLDLLHALKTLRLLLDSKWLNTKTSQYSAVHITGGGSFELICYNVLQDFMKQNAVQLDMFVTACCEALCTALMAVPLRLLHNSFQPRLATVLYIKESIRSSPALIHGFDGSTGHQLPVDTTIIEPLLSKIVAIEHVLELTEQLLRINSLLHVRNLAPKSSEDEIEQS